MIENKSLGSKSIRRCECGVPCFESRWSASCRYGMSFAFP